MIAVSTPDNLDLLEHLTSIRLFDHLRLALAELTAANLVEIERSAETRTITALFDR